MTRIAIVVGNIRPNRMTASVAEGVLENATHRYRRTGLAR